MKHFDMDQHVGKLCALKIKGAVIVDVIEHDDAPSLLYPYYGLYTNISFSSAGNNRYAGVKIEEITCEPSRIHSMIDESIGHAKFDLSNLTKGNFVVMNNGDLFLVSDVKKSNYEFDSYDYWIEFNSLSCQEYRCNDLGYSIDGEGYIFGYANTIEEVERILNALKLKEGKQ